MKKLILLLSGILGITITFCDTTELKAKKRTLHIEYNFFEEEENEERIILKPGYLYDPERKILIKQKRNKTRIGKPVIL